MILTNTVSRLSQNEYSGALDNYSRAMRRISAGIKIQSPKYEVIFKRTGEWTPKCTFYLQKNGATIHFSNESFH